MRPGWRLRLRRWARPHASDICDHEWALLLGSSPLFRQLDDHQLAGLRQLCALFLARKTFTGGDGLVLSRAQCLAVAALCCLPVLQLGFKALSGWREVIIYARRFRVPAEHVDEYSGVITQGHDEVIGEAWDRGPVILSWADVAGDLAHPFDGINVAVHEIAHKLDMLDGAMNGVPALPPRMSRKQWIDVMQQAFDTLCEQVAEGGETAIDPYGSEGADEFFAVVSEMHFSAPGHLAAAAPAVAELLRLFYGDFHPIGAPRNGCGQDTSPHGSPCPPPATSLRG